VGTKKPAITGAKKWRNCKGGPSSPFPRVYLTGNEIPTQELSSTLKRDAFRRESRLKETRPSLHPSTSGPLRVKRGPGKGLPTRTVQENGEKGGHERRKLAIPPLALHGNADGNKTRGLLRAKKGQEPGPISASASRKTYTTTGVHVKSTSVGPFQNERKRKRKETKSRGKPSLPTLSPDKNNAI